jgi:AcrR family transcriptional regulator
MEDGSKTNRENFNIFKNRYTLPLGEIGSKTKEHILLGATKLFAEKGYASVSVRDIVRLIGIKPASFYNHFTSKEALWDTVLSQAESLYLLYFMQLDEILKQSQNFKEVLEIIFDEPKQLRNVFTCYAFVLIQSEKFRDERAGRIYNDIFIRYSVNFIKDWFDQCITRGFTEKFDALTVATIILDRVMIGLSLKVQEYLGRPSPYDVTAMFANLQEFILNSVKMPN